jgi:Tfp pilus assembly protein PilV
VTGARLGDQRGETLIELMITITIMASAIVAVLAGIAVAVNSSDEQKKDVGVTVVLHDFAEAVQAAPYSSTPCAAPTGINYSAPSGFQALTTPQVTGCYNTTNGTWCTPPGCTDYGLVRLKLTVTTSDASGPHQRTKTLEMVKAKDYVRPS